MKKYIFLLTFVAFFFCSNVSAQTSNYESIINTAGLQSMLTQKITRFFIIKATGKATPEQEKQLGVCIEKFDANLAELAKVSASPAVGEKLKACENNWKDFKQIVTSSTDRENATKTFKRSAEMLKATDDLTVELTKYFKSKGAKASAELMDEYFIEIISLASKQRFSSQRVAICYRALYEGIEPELAVSELKAAWKLYNDQQYTISSAVSNNQKLIGAMDEVLKKWNVIRSKADELNGKKIQPLDFCTMIDDLMISLNAFNDILITEATM